MTRPRPRPPRRRRDALRLLGAGLLAASFAVFGCGEACSCEQLPQAAPVTVYVVRHAEKQAVAEDADEALRKDPPLSREGQLRAMGLAEDLPVKDLDAIYVTATTRSEDTAAAVAAVTGLEPIHYPPQDVDGLVARLRRQAGSQALVVGHSNTVPPLLQALGVTEAVTIDEGQYGDLWVVHANADGSATLEHRRFGEAIERFDPGK